MFPIRRSGGIGSEMGERTRSIKIVAGLYSSLLLLVAMRSILWPFFKVAFCNPDLYKTRHTLSPSPFGRFRARDSDPSFDTARLRKDVYIRDHLSLPGPRSCGRLSQCERRRGVRSR